MMAVIYSDASVVNIWLGEGDPSTEAGMRIVRVLDQTIYGFRIIELVITKECNYRGVIWNEVSRNPR